MTSHSKKCYLFAPPYGIQEYTFRDLNSAFELTNKDGKTSHKSKKKFEADYGLFPEQAILKRYNEQKKVSEAIIKKAQKQIQEEQEFIQGLYKKYEIEEMMKEYPEEFI